MTDTTRFKTTEAYISGGITGRIWWPTGQQCGRPFRVNYRSITDRFSTDDATFRETLLSYLAENGGDFQDAEFTADTELVIIRRRVLGNGRYELHTRTRTLDQLHDCADLVNAEVYTSDVIGE